MNIKSRRKVYPVKDGDYLWFNGSAFGFTPKDKSILPMSGFIRPERVRVSKKEAQRIVKEHGGPKIVFDGMTVWKFGPQHVTRLTTESAGNVKTTGDLAALTSDIT